MKNIFEQGVTNEVIARIEQLSPETQRQWGKMSVAQMLAHLSVSYDMTYEPERFTAPTGIKKFLIRTLVKKFVTNEKPYKANGQTSPEFVISDARDFEKEKERLINYLTRTQALGATHFDGKENVSFGKMNVQEWNNMFYKHLDHHLRQFGV